jgi:sugar/nucleoside kinase (ribokinase family)
MNSPQAAAPRLVGIGSIFIDDIVLPDGQTHMAQLGGGVTHALLGAAVWDERPGIVALVGRDLPPDVCARLERHFDTRGLITVEHPQARAWQLFEADGTRRELYRSDPITPFIVGARPHHLPPVYHGARGYYLLQNFEGIAAWQPVLNGFILWEPLQQIMTPGSRPLLAQALRQTAVDLVSPNLSEARAVYGSLPPEALIHALLDDGAAAAALRMGPDGSLVGTRAGDMSYIPAAPAACVADQTGAGNTYCGGLLAGIVQGKPLRTAAAMGAVAASFCIEGVGTVQPNSVNPAERDRRLQAVLDTA